MKRRKLVLGALPLLVWGLVAGASHAVTASVRARADAAAFADGGPERLLADLERLRALGLFAGRGRAHDAAPVLNRLVAADGPVEGTTPAWWAQPGAFAAFEPVRKEWWSHSEITESYDLSFLREWRGLDHWEWASADPFAAHFAAHPEQCSVETPLVNYVPFPTMAKIRMAQGIHRNEVDEAAADVETLALLAYSSDHLVGALIGVAMLGIEAHGLEEARKAGKTVTHTHGWTKEDRALAKEAFAGVTALFLHDPGSDVARTLVDRADELPGVCAGLAEAVWKASLLREHLADPWPGEPDQGGFVRALDDALARSGCGIASPRAAWARSQAGCFDAVPEDDPWARLVEIPYARSPVLAELLALGAPNFVGPYGVTPP